MKASAQSKLDIAVTLMFLMKVFVFIVLIGNFAKYDGIIYIKHI